MVSLMIPRCNQGNLLVEILIQAETASADTGSTVITF